MDVEQLPSRFQARTRVESDSECWLWVGSRTQKGYGRINGRLAHRTAYELLVGEIPDGLVIDHLCRNPSCINPAHLEVVTNRENVLRGQAAQVARERCARITHCPRGHPYDEENTYSPPSQPAKRRCRACSRLREAQRGPRDRVAERARAANSGNRSL